MSRRRRSGFGYLSYLYIVLLPHGEDDGGSAQIINLTLIRLTEDLAEENLLIWASSKKASFTPQLGMARLCFTSTTSN